MCIACHGNDQRILVKNVPVWALMKMRKMAERQKIGNEPVIRYDWYKDNSGVLFCVFTYKYWDGYQWSEDAIQYEPQR